MDISIKNLYYKIKDGCWHNHMSQPITIKGKTYRICIDCSKYRLFDTTTWEMYGSYFSEKPNDELTLHEKRSF
jgi:hypothetical protein